MGLAWVYDDRTDITPTAQDRADMEVYLFRHPDPATGNLVGKPGGIEVWPVELELSPLNPQISLTPDTPATRASVQAKLIALQKTISPGQTMLITALRTAIGTASGVTDYTLNLTDDIPAEQNELITVGEIEWLTV
ncbi:gp47 family phage protein [Trabulsiella guamensis ATCC 49490]|uniref:Gp47 family phage protein n=1 Tax=Trabulsiella guamensis ATCC 49490 TaxID=1005994 RepID=A0A084Z0M7_9ENTR|nr:gp47 family phage protein [Trabulsiella guamensis ATCC 49490]